MFEVRALMTLFLQTEVSKKVIICIVLKTRFFQTVEFTLIIYDTIQIILFVSLISPNNERYLNQSIVSREP